MELSIIVVGNKKQIGVNPKKNDILYFWKLRLVCSRNYKCIYKGFSIKSRKKIVSNKA